MPSHPAWEPIRLPDNDFRVADVLLTAHGWWPWFALAGGVLIIAIGGVVFSP